jgi:hypothetical protein
MGPVQVLVIGIEHPTFDGQVLSELARLRDSGIVRLLDLLVVRRGDDQFETVDLPAELGAPDGSIVAAIVGHPSGDTNPHDERPEVASWSLADAIPAGSLAAVALIEHLWAGPLVSAIARSGGTALEETWLAAPDRDALAALLADRDRSGSATG